ncbi:MAG: hypothetical protein KDC45_00025 [Bacteroidetes bacterium]|nr:hypothetical protein [Bacteroidota bacterium]
MARRVKKKPAKKKTAKKKAVKRAAGKKPVRKKTTRKMPKKPVKKKTRPTARKKPSKRVTRQSKSSRKTAKKAPSLTPEQLTAKVQNRVESFIKKLYKNNYERNEDGRFLIFEGSTVVQTVVRPWHAGDVVVETFAYVVQDARLDENLMKFLLRENALLHFGAFGITFDGTIIYSNSLAGANLDENEFKASLKSVARIADHYDNQIVKDYGGMTAREAMRMGLF